MHSVEDIPLQQRKQARTRIALLNTALELMRTKALAEITVDEICREVEVSKMTFFRYFPRKADLIFYTIRLLNIELAWNISKLGDTKNGLAAIEVVFKLIAEVIKDNPRFFSELIALRALEPEVFLDFLQNLTPDVSRAERLIRFPEYDGIDSMQEEVFVDILENQLKIAIANHELPETTDIDEAVLSLVGILYSVPIMVDSQNLLKNLTETYQRQLQILWTGLRHVDPI